MGRNPIDSLLKFVYDGAKQTRLLVKTIRYPYILATQKNKFGFGGFQTRNCV